MLQPHRIEYQEIARLSEHLVLPALVIFVLEGPRIHIHVAQVKYATKHPGWAPVVVPGLRANSALRMRDGLH